jgi:CRP-like cAMP-binding protein
MSRPNQSSVRNHLLKRLTPDDYTLIQPHLEAVTLDKHMVLFEPMQPISHAYFPDSGLGSVIAISPGGSKSEVGLFGCDGMAGIPLLLGLDRTPCECVMQVAGAGHRVPAGMLRDVMQQSQSFREALLPYAHAFAVQTAHTALSNAQHTVEERLARWLLMTHDRMADDVAPLTHEFLALMLAIRRPSVTTALHIIEGIGLIRNTRGCIVVRDRAGLEAFAADAYGVPEAEYERVIGSLRKRVPAQIEREQPDGTVVPFRRDAPE